MQEYICHFCQQPTNFVCQEELKNHGLLLYLCYPCQAEYLCWDNNPILASISLYATITDKIYKWSFPVKGPNKLWLVHGNIPATPGISTFKGKLIKKLPDSLTGITPTNICDKIITILTFL